MRILLRGARRSVAPLALGVLTSLAACRDRDAARASDRDASRASLATATRRDSGTLPEWLPGVWSREFITRHGVVGESLVVRYVQTPAEFGDVRIPANRPALRGASGFADLDDAALRALARQKGFTGSTSASGGVITWHHEIDFQPDTSRDASFVTVDDATHIRETGLDSSFVERYVALAPAPKRHLAVRVTRGGRLDRVLIVAGDWFYFARNRARDLPPAESLEALIDRAHPTRAELVAWLDCELSAGRVRGGRVPWEIERSTLPWQEGRRLAFADSLRVDGSGALKLPAASAGEAWQVTRQAMSSTELATLFRAAP
ncbi:MAG: hypothetical protein HY275_00525 [Gemmatimonadetes bacterium]|nr:hypothetical protein [Gemmatimonadota bacterium]